MQERHQLRHVAMSGNQLIVDIAGMGGRVADPIEAGQFSQATYQRAQPPFPAVGSLSVVGIHVLAEQGDLAYPAMDELARLGQNPRYRARIFRAARVRYDTETAKLVAAFLHGQKSGYALGGCSLGQEVEFGFRRKARVEDSGASHA